MTGQLSDADSAFKRSQQRLRGIWRDQTVSEVVVVLPHAGPEPFDSESTGLDICVHSGVHEIKVFAFPTIPIPGQNVETLAALDTAVGHLRLMFSVGDLDLHSIPLPDLPAHIMSVFCVRIPRAAVMPESATPTDNDYAIAAMDKAVGAIQRVLHGYMIATEDPRIDYDSIQKFGKFAYMLFVDISKRVLCGGTFTLQREHPYQRPDDYLRRLDDGIATEMSEHPIDRVVLWRLRANRAYQGDRDDAAAVLFLNTSVEMLIGAVYRAMLRDDERANLSRVKRGIDQFIPRLREVGERLQCGPWNLKDTASEVGRYVDQLYALRGRIVHGGFTPTTQQTEAAFEAGGDLRCELERRIIDARARFPVTCLLLNSRQSLEDRKLYIRRVRDTHERMVRDEDPRHWFTPQPA
jgi:hypothetical protein